MNRRYFFGTAIGALTAGRVRALAPSDQVNVAIVGVGGRGRALIGDFAKVPGANIRYLVDANQASLEKGMTLVKKLGLPAPQVAVDMRRVLEAKDVDAVIATTFPAMLLCVVIVLFCCLRSFGAMSVFSGTTTGPVVW